MKINREIGRSNSELLDIVGNTAKRHVCGNGAKEWRGQGLVEYGPYSENIYLTKSKYLLDSKD